MLFIIAISQQAGGNKKKVLLTEIYYTKTAKDFLEIKQKAYGSHHSPSQQLILEKTHNNTITFIIILNS